MTLISPLSGTRGSLRDRSEVQPRQSEALGARQVCYRRRICGAWPDQLSGTSVWRRWSHPGQGGHDDDDGHQQPPRHRDRQEQEEPQSEAEEEAEQEQVDHRLHCINIFPTNIEYTQSNINSNTKV